jgi:hypothetical protein
MSESETTAVAEATPVVKKQRKAPSKAAKSVKKKVAKKKGSKKAAGKPRAKKDGLRKPQIRILQTLSKNSKALSRKDISEKADVDLAMMNSYIGSSDKAVRSKNDKAVCVSLLTLGYIKEDLGEEGGPAVYKITAAGHKALEATK